MCFYSFFTIVNGCKNSRRAFIYKYGNFVIKMQQRSVTEFVKMDTLHIVVQKSRQKVGFIIKYIMFGWRISENCLKKRKLFNLQDILHRRKSSRMTYRWRHKLKQYFHKNLTMDETFIHHYSSVVS